MDENSGGSNSNNELAGDDKKKVKELEGDLEEIINKEKIKPVDITSKVLTGASTEASTVNVGNSGNKSSVGSSPGTFESVKTDVGGFQTDGGGKQNVQDPVPSMVNGGEKSGDEKIKILLKVAIIIFVISLLVLFAYIIGARKEESGMKVEETALPVMTDAALPIATNTPQPATASPSASATPTMFLKESTPSSFLQTATPSGSPGL